MFGTEKAADNHNTQFEFNEYILKVAVKIYALSALKLCENVRI